MEIDSGDDEDGSDVAESEGDHDEGGSGSDNDDDDDDEMLEREPSGSGSGDMGSDSGVSSDDDDVAESTTKYWSKKYNASIDLTSTRNKNARSLLKAPSSSFVDPFEVYWSEEQLLERIATLENCDEVVGMEFDARRKRNDLSHALNPSMDRFVTLLTLQIPFSDVLILRMADDMPYHGDCVMIMPFPFNVAKMVLPVFKTTKSLRAAAEKDGIGIREYTRKVLVDWTVRFLENFPVECASLSSSTAQCSDDNSRAVIEKLIEEREREESV